MKKAKQTLTAALAATLATGAVGTVASAASMDDMYAAAYNAMVKAQTEKTQTAINEARVAINALPKDMTVARGEFSKLVDAVQQPIYTQIIALIEKGQKEAKQETVNEGRKLLVGVEEAYAKTWSSNFDTIQQTLVNNATEAVKAAIKSQKAEDITKAEAAVAEIKTTENADVKKVVEGLEKDLVEKLDVRVTKVEVMNATTVQVTFSKDLDDKSIDNEDFVIKNGTIRNYVKESKLVEGKKNVVELTLQTKIDEAKKYELTVSGVKDSKGGNVKSTTTEIKYEKKAVASAEFTSKKLVRGANVRDTLLVKDEAGRNITKEAKLTFECSTDKDIVTKEGKVSSSAKIGKEVNVRVYEGDKLLIDQTLTVAENGAETLLAFTVSAESVDKDTKLADITPNCKMKVGKTNVLTIFYKDALGNEKSVEGGKLKKLESLDKDVISIGGGKLTAKKEGVATLKVQYGEVVEEIQVEVVKTGLETATLTMDDTSINVAKSDVEKTVNFKLKNTASGESVSPSSVQVKIYNQSSTSQWNTTDAITVRGKVIAINGKKLPEGDIAAKLIVTYQNVKYEQEFNINVQKAEDITSYELVAVDKNGKVIDSLDEKDAEKATLKVYAIDENGNRVAFKDNIKSVKLCIDEDTNGKEIKDSKTGNAYQYAVESLNVKKGEHSYYAKVEKHGSSAVDTNTVTLTTENTDSEEGWFDMKTTVTTASSLGSLMSWSYDEKVVDYSANVTGIDTISILADAGSEDVNVTLNGKPMNLKEALAEISETKDPNAKLNNLKFTESGDVKIKVDKLTVKNKDNKIKPIYPSTTEHDIEVTE